MTDMALQDLRIIDLSRVLAGPYCTMLLADYGAEVIKIEEPVGGDGTRQWGPPWIGDQSAYYLSANRNKRSLTLNLKTEQGLEILRQLLQDADVLIENFKAGTMEKFGLGYETLAAEFPGLIYCSLTGYGQTGPYRDRPGYDFMIQAQGGLMSITGPEDGEPYKVGVAIADITTGLFAANAILAALHYRTQTGRGQFIDIALLDSQVAWLANVAHNYFATGETPARYGNAHPNIVPYQIFSTQDRQIALAVGNDQQYKRLCEVLERPDLWADERFQTNAGRVDHRDELIPLLEAALKTQPADTWTERLLAAKIPVAPVNTIPQILNDPHIRAREMVQEIEHPTLGRIQMLGAPTKLSATPATIRRAPPTLGEDTSAILADLGFSDDEIQGLRRDGVV